MSEWTNEAAIRAWEKSGAASLSLFGPEGDFARQHLLNPAIFVLFGSAHGKHILDVGCGNGYLSRLLARKGAIVTGIEPSTPFFRAAQDAEQRDPLGIIYHQADISSVEPSLGPFDGIIANMVLMDIPAYQHAITNCVSMLRPGGQFVFSLAHPCFEERGSGFNDRGYIQVEDYFTERAISQTYAPLFHRPLQAYINAVCNAGCSVRRMIEPQLHADIVAAHPEYRREAVIPCYIIISATKDSLSES